MPNANRDVGHQFERDVAAYCRANGMPRAERKSDPGFSARGHVSPDSGDIRGIPGVCIQAKRLVKSAPRGLCGKALTNVMAEAAQQADAAGAALWLVIEKRPGHLIGECWAHLAANMFSALAFGIDPYSPVWSTYTHPIRIEFRHIVKHVAEFSAMCAEVAA